MHVRDTNCVHAALVELKSQGAADFWMIGEATFPLTLFAFSPQDMQREESAEMMRGAARFIDSLRELLSVDRVRAAAKWRRRPELPKEAAAPTTS